MWENEHISLYLLNPYLRKKLSFFNAKNVFEIYDDFMTYFCFKYNFKYKICKDIIV